jgi:hypothetical protein
MSGVPEQPARLKRAASSKNVRDVLGLGHPAWLKVLLVGDSYDEPWIGARQAAPDRRAYVIWACFSGSWATGGARYCWLAVLPRPFRHPIFKATGAVEHHPALVVRNVRFYSGKSQFLAAVRTGDLRNKILIAVVASRLVCGHRKLPASRPRHPDGAIV